MLADFNTHKPADPKHAARLAWLCSLEPTALRDLLILAMRRAQSEHQAARSGLIEPSPLGAEWADACGGLADFLEILIED